MRILYYSFEYGGVTTTFIRNELEHFAKNHEIRYLCQKINQSGTVPKYVRIIPFVQNIIKRKLFWWLWKYDILCYNHSSSYSSEIEKFVNEFNPDIIHCHFGYEALYLLDNLRSIRSKVILHFHGYDASQMLKKRSYIKRLKYILNLPFVFPITCNKYFANEISKLTNIPISRFFVLYYGIDVNLFDPYSPKIDREEDIFLQVSSLNEKKGHEYTLHAFSKLRLMNGCANSKLIITGDGPRRTKLEILARELEIEPFVQFVGSVNSKEVVQLMNSASVFVHHSITSENGDKEGIPNSLIEAMAMELPVVSTWHSGIPELVEDGLNGFLVKEKDVIQYASRMFDALNMGKLKVNRNKVISQFEIGRHNRELDKLYSHVLDGQASFQREYYS